MGSSKRTKFRDPDIAGLVEASGGKREPRDLIIREARKLTAEFRAWSNDRIQPLERIKVLASLRGFRVFPMQAHHDHHRDAVVMRDPSGVGGQIFYNTVRPDTRILFSIAHEIVHGFFPTTGPGIRFREMTADTPPERDELERLCDAGAAELVMPTDEFQPVVGDGWTIRNLAKLMSVFGASYEATLYRLASACPGVALAGLLRYRRTKAEELKLRLLGCGLQKSLFETDLAQEVLTVAMPKYRRQSLHVSASCPKSYMIPWNKSFDLSSCVYRTDPDRIVSRFEVLPVAGVPKGILEAVDAPYQRRDSDPDHQDVLFYWRAA